MSTEKTAKSSTTALTTVLLTPLPWSSLQMGPLIGSGGYGDVYQATWEGKAVAVKQLHLKTLSADLTADFEREAKLMAQCQFSQVVELYGICEDPGHVAMVMEYLPKGSLYQVLHDSRETLPWNPIRWNIAIDMGKGLSYLHSQKILHRDLKSLNVLLDQNYRAKITDFGLAKIKLETNSTSTKTKQGMGTTRWRAPELFKRGSSPTFASDAYGYGMVLWEVATRNLPYADAQDDATVISWIKDDEKETISPDIPKTYATIIEQAWQTAPEKRPQVHEMVLKLQAGRTQMGVPTSHLTLEAIKPVWGRKKRPRHQPIYQVESAKVKGTAIGAVFKTHDKPYSLGWLGKLGYFRGLTPLSTPQMTNHSLVRRSSVLEAMVEKVAGDLYVYLSEGNYHVPKTRLAELPIRNTYTEQHPFTQTLYDDVNEGRKEPIEDGVYVLSKKVAGYHDLAELTVCVLGTEQKGFREFLEAGKVPEYAILEGKKLPLLGVMEILAAGRLLGDTDVLGGGGNNAGYVLEYDAQGEVIALRAVKIDPGFAFNFRGVENQFYQSQNPSAPNSNLLKQDKRNLQHGNLAPAIQWKHLTPGQQQQFIGALDKGLKALRKIEVINQLLNREGFKETPKQRELPSLQSVLGENAASIEENLGWQEVTYADELKAHRTLSNLPKEIVLELSTLKATLAQKESDLKQQQERYQQHKVIWEQEKNQLVQNLVNEKQIAQKQAKTITEKEKAHEQQQQVLLNQQQTMRNQEQALIAKEQQLNKQAQQLKVQEKEIDAQKQNAKKLSKQVEELSTQLTQKVSSLTEANEKQERENQQLAQENRQLKQALQAASDREMALKVERNETKGTPAPTRTAAKGNWLGNLFAPATPPASPTPTLKSSQGRLSYADQVESASKSVQDKINAEDLKALLKWVTEGHLEEVEKLLKKNPSLGLGTGTVTDRSHRTFKNITVLQYAAWALDAEMAELIVKYVGAHYSGVQLKALEMAPERYSEYGASYDCKGLVNNYQTYLDNYSEWNGDKCTQYWQKKIGGEQRKCPAWLIYAWSEEGYDVAWTKQDGKRTIKREYDKHRLDWWFTESYTIGRGVWSTNWAATRGDDMHGWVSQMTYPHTSQRDAGVNQKRVRHDQHVVSVLVTTRRETLQRLLNEVERSLEDNTRVPGLKQ